MTANHEYTPSTEQVREAYVVGVDPEVTARYRAEFDRWLDARDARIIAAAKVEAYKEAQRIIAGDMTIAEQRGRRGADKIYAAYLIRELDQEIQDLQEGDDETH